MSALIVTLQLDPDAQSRFDALRRAHFPPDRDYLAAHVTLFHALPAAQEQQVRADLAEAAARPAFPVAVRGLRPLGRGVAYVLESPHLDDVRAGLAARWEAVLTRQDSQRFRAHVTVQNKVPPEQARALLERLRADFSPYDAQARGLALWRYLGGPWEPLGDWAFGS